MQNRRRRRTIAGRHHDPREMSVEDFQEQEYEFLRRLEEERIGRRKLLKRGLAGAAGLTVIALPEAALAARQKALANPPLRGTKKNLAQLVAAAKKEGKPERDRAAARLGELRRDASRRSRRSTAFRSRATTPMAPRRRRTRRSCRSRATHARPTVVDVTASSRSRHQRGPLRPVLRLQRTRRPARDEGHARLLDRRLLGLGHDRLQREPRQHAAEDVRRPVEARATRTRSR